MDIRDIVGQGRDQEPGPWARRVPRLVAAAAVVLVAAALIATHLPHHSGARARPHPPPAEGQAQAGSSVAVASGIAGPTLPWGTGARLPVAGAQPMWYWPATGRTSPIRGLPRDDSGYQFIRVGGGWAVQPGPGARHDQGGSGGCGCAAAPPPVYFLGDQARSAVLIGVADRAAPGSAAGDVWLTSYPPGVDPGTAAATAQEVSGSGARLGPALRLPDGYAIVQGTDRGLLLAPASPGQGAANDDMLWAPAHPDADRTFANVVAAGPSAVALAPRCSPACRLQVSDLVTGRDASVALPAGSSAASAAFSPDGQFLAIEVSFLETGNDGDQAAQLDVASVASGRVSVVPGSWVSSDALVGFGWPARGDSLVAELSFTTKVQVASWLPGAARLTVAAVRPGTDSAFLVLG